MRTATQGATPRAWPLAIFGLTILLSAFLLFQVQPLVSKAILPWFGGSPAVWTTCMLFFQVVLFAGYVYAHLLQNRFSPRGQATVHLLLVLAAMALLPIAPSLNWKTAGIGSPVLHILMLLTATVGLPYFALSATSPLLQAWFSRSQPGRSPYRLYALSNVGSLAALLSYPFVFEPAFDLRRQSSLWSGGFVGYVLLCGVCLISLWRWAATAKGKGDSENSQPLSAGAVLAATPTAFDRLRWLTLPALASLMLLATTNHVCQDVAVVPFLWVTPLALYLLSFILCFDSERWYRRWFWAGLAIASLVAAGVNDHLNLSGSHLSLVKELVLYFTALLAACMVCHGELARLKPDPRHLTEFYLLISAGGAIGGILVAVVAPLIFSTFLEWQIGLAATVILAVGLLTLPGFDVRTLLIRRSLFLAVVALGVIYVSSWAFDRRGIVDRARNFFGTVTIAEHDAEEPDLHEIVLKNGRITHGRQFTAPDRRNWATTYYGKESGVGRAIEYLQKRGPVSIGAVGLGTGTLACYARPEDRIRFYEINPEVIRAANTHFTYLKDCRGTQEVVLGDARLSLEAESPQHYQLLVLDAFSGDAIPTHLLTREAFEVYRRHLAPGGVIAVHVSNYYLRLAPVVYRLAKECGMKTSRICQRPSAEDEKQRLVHTSEWILVTDDEQLLRAHPSVPEKQPYDDWRVRLWTDDYSNLFQILSKWY